MNILHELVKEFANGNGAIFVGSGLSIGAGLPGRKELTKQLALEFEGDLSGTADEDIVQYYCDEYGRHALVSQLREKLDVFHVKPTIAHNALVKLPVNQIFTTNYDNLLEKALENCQRKFNIIVESEETGFPRPDFLQLFKLHGDLTRPKSIVLTNQDYYLYFDEHKTLVRFLITALQTKVVLFIGYSAKDVNFCQMLAKARAETGNFSRNAFIILFNANQFAVRSFENQKIRVINLEVEDEKNLAEAQRQQYFNQTLTNWLEEFYQQIQAKQEVLKEQSRPSTKPLPAEPYKFLDYFTSKDTAIFFGRQQETEKLINLIQAYRLTILYGESGTGKTSLLQAAVLPNLEEERQYTVVYARPLRDPLFEVQEAICTVFRNKFGREMQMTGLREMVEDGLPEGKQFLIVLDQFEEFFIRQGEETRSQFVQELVGLLSIASRDVRCLLSLRNDYLDRLDELELLLGKDPLLHRMRLYPLGSEAASAAITGPAAAFKIFIDGSLVEKLLQDLKQVEIAPAQLQVVCYELWQDWKNRGKPESGMTLSQYLEIGDIRTILTDYLENVIQGLDTAEVQKNYGLKLDGESAQKGARAILKSMVTSEQTKVAVTMREITHHELLNTLDILEKEAEKLLKYLRDKRIIRRLPDANQYELAHEVMVEKIWKWLDKEERYLLDLKDMLAAAMNEYRKFHAPLPLDRLNLIAEQAEHLSLEPDELELLLRSAIQYDADPRIWVTKMESTKVINILSELLEKPIHNRPQIAIALGHTRSPKALRYLENLLLDKNDKVQRAATKALGKMNVPAVNQLLYRAIQQETKLTRAAKLIEALEQDKSRETVNMLMEIASTHTNDNVCLRAANALFRLELVDVRMIIRQLANSKRVVREAAKDALKGRTQEVLQELKGMLKDADFKVRMDAVKAISVFDYKHIKELCKEALSDKNPLIRKEVIGILGKSNDSTIAEILIDQLCDNDIQVRDKVVECLLSLSIFRELNDSYQERKKESPGISIIKFLVTCLRDENNEVRQQAVQLLERLDDERVIEPLVNCLRDENSEIRQQAIKLLKKQDYQRLIGAFIDCLQNENSEIRQQVVKLLEQLDDERVIEPIVACLQDKDSSLRQEAVKIFGQLGKRWVIEPLIACLQDEDSQVRGYAIGALRQFSDERMIEPLIACLQDEDSQVRGYAVIALGYLEAKRAIPSLITCLQDEDSEVRWHTVRALGHLGDKRALEPLIACLKDEDSEVRWHAVIALRLLGDKRALEPLIACLQDEDTQVRGHAVEALRWFRDERLIEPILIRLRDKNSFVRGQAVLELEKLGDNRAIEPLIACLQDESSQVRAQAASALGKLGDNRAIEPLIACLQDESSQVRVQVVCALGELGGEQVIKPLIASCLHDKDEVRGQAVSALKELGDNRAIEPLVAGLQNEDSKVRKHAIYALRQLGDVKIIEPLRAFSERETDDEVRQLAVEVLSKLEENKNANQEVT